MSIWLTVHDYRTKCILSPYKLFSRIVKKLILLQGHKSESHFDVGKRQSIFYEFSPIVLLKGQLSEDGWGGIRTTLWPAALIVSPVTRAPPPAFPSNPRGTPRVPAPLPLSPFSPPDRDRRPAAPLRPRLPARGHPALPRRVPAAAQRRQWPPWRHGPPQLQSDSATGRKVPLPATASQGKSPVPP